MRFDFVNYYKINQLKFQSLKTRLESKRSQMQRFLNNNPPLNLDKEKEKVRKENKKLAMDILR